MDVKDYSYKKLEDYLSIRKNLLNISVEEIKKVIKDKKDVYKSKHEKKNLKYLKEVEKYFNKGYYKGNEIEHTVGNRIIKGILTGEVLPFPTNTSGSESIIPWFYFKDKINSRTNRICNSILDAKIKIIKKPKNSFNENLKVKKENRSAYPDLVLT